MPALTLDTPTGRFTLWSDGAAITRAEWAEACAADRPDAVLAGAARQVEAYFTGALRRFDLPLRIEASSLQRAACGLMAEIPWGETTTYGALAKRLAVPPQTAGQACGGNPIPLIIPCHRVLAADGLGGFSGRHGVETKVWLLKHEGAAGLLI